jgi:hypothetical protein
MEQQWGFSMTRSESKMVPLTEAHLAQAAADAVRKAYAMGLVDERTPFAELTYPIVRRAAARVREAGIAVDAASRVERGDPSDVEGLAAALRSIDEMLDQSPLPSSEWPRLVGVLGRDLLARLLRIGTSSVGRYERAERETPDAVAARLHWLALVVGDLAGAYNEIGIRRWFDRKRSALDGRAPAQVLAKDWRPEDEGPGRARALARALVFSPAT